MQCRLFPGAFVLKRTVDFLEAKTHPKRLFIAEYIHNTNKFKPTKKKIKQNTGIGKIKNRKIVKIERGEKPADASESSDVTRSEVIEDGADEFIGERFEVAECVGSAVFGRETIRLMRNFH